MGTFYNICIEEMHEFLSEQGFQTLNLPRTAEIVYGKIIHVDNARLSLRVYTGINPTGESRSKGKDAIRVQPYYMYDDIPSPVGKSQKCLRVKTWRKNLQAAIDRQTDPEHFRICPGCGYPMVLRYRKKDNQPFWGCVTWAKTGCKGRPMKQSPKIEQPQQYTKEKGSLAQSIGKSKQYKIPDEQISKYQKYAESIFVDTNKHVIIGARAGSGKTTMLRHIAAFRQRERVVMLAFNRRNAKDGQKKLPRSVKCVTTHAFCSHFLKDEVKMPKKAEKGKTWQVINNLYPAMDDDARKRIRKTTVKMVGLAKNFACRPGDVESIKSVMDSYAFETRSDKEDDAVVDLTSEVLKLSMPGQKFGTIYDFDDMLWWPVVLGLRPPKYDWVLADECQDFNACQIELLLRMAEDGARIVAVGDRYQAVYRFRGADCDAYDNIKAMLEGFERGCEEAILPISYRQGRAIIEFVQSDTHVKDIEAAPNAHEGLIDLDSTYMEVLDLVTKEYAKAA